jgi:hypothetical protein
MHLMLGSCYVAFDLKIGIHIIFEFEFKYLIGKKKYKIKTRWIKRNKKIPGWAAAPYRPTYPFPTSRPNTSRKPTPAPARAHSNFATDGRALMPGLPSPST